MRGVESKGMLCSQSELGGQDNEGLWILPKESKIGLNLNEFFPSVFDLEITPNRPDCLSHIGVARELSAICSKKLKQRDNNSADELSLVDTTDEAIKIQDTNLCPLYTLRKITNVKVSPSPYWLQAKLEAIGLRSINNVVDVTNYVMMELGQPLHAFDSDKVDGEIIVRNANSKESFQALDGKSYELSPDDLIISDSKTPLALAGIMGGENSGVNEKTHTIFHCKYCDYSTSRKSSWNKHLKTKKHKEKCFQMFPNCFQKVAKKLQNEEEKSKPLFFCRDCGKTYKTRTGLWKHKKKCGTYIEKSTKKKVPVGIDEEIKLVELETKKLELEKQKMINKKIKSGEITGLEPNISPELIKTIAEVAGDNNCNNTQNISINMFLNDYCQNALSIEDFVDRIKLSLTDLISTERIGYVSGVSNILINSLKDLSSVERPIHCTNQKKLEFVVKKEDKWDTDRVEVDNVIESITRKRIKILHEWEKENPNYLEDKGLTQTWNQLIHDIMEDADESKERKNKEEIKQNLGGVLFIDEAIKNL